jgi:uncharacterized protein (TIGR02246 family)
MTKRLSATLFILLFYISNVFCAAPAVDPAKIRKVVDEANAKSLQTWKNGDAAGFAALFAEDAIAMTLNHANVKGRQRIQELRAQTVKSVKLVEGTIKTEEFDASGNLAYEAGSFSYKLQPVGRPAYTLSGRYLVVWKQQKDGSWKIQVHAGLPDSSR